MGHKMFRIKMGLSLVSRLRLDAALYEFALSPAKGQRGRHRKKGDRLTSLKELASDAAQLWHETEVDWYSSEKKKVSLLAGINLWY